MNVIITGVSKGLGFSITKELLKDGWCVYGISRTSNKELEALVTEYPGNLKLITFDLINTIDIKEKVFKNWIGFDKPIHAFVNNAAIAYDDIISNLDITSLENMFKVNVYSPMMITKYVIRQMLLHKVKGNIVHISSISVHTGYKGLSMYAATKGAIEAFSKNTAREWGGRGVRSNCIVAGFMETEMSATLNQSQKDRIYNRTSLKAPVDLNSISSTINFLLNNKGSSITGQNIFIDNGTI